MLHTKKVPIYDEKGEPIILLGISSDITDRLRAEKELEKYQAHLEELVEERTKKLEKAKKKAEDINRLKSDFLATMSHEIRTPMSGILGMAELVLHASPNDQISGYANTIINSAESLLTIINDILDFSKIEAQKLELESVPINLLDVADYVANLYALQARDKALELVVDYKPGSENFVYGDAERLKQILGNLVNNAIKFTEQGHIVLEIEELKDLDIEPNIVAMRFCVKDTGIGMDSEIQSRIFEKFRQSDASTTRKYGGTGLGLSICKSLISLMGGEIVLESHVGKGSVFSFVLHMPRNTDKAKKVLKKDRQLQGCRILVVDDLYIIREMVSKHMHLSDVRCDAAEGADEALKLMRKAAQDGDPYHIALLDYLIPDVNGEMLACTIKGDPALKDTCLILMTSAGNSSNFDAFAQKGFSAYIQKPFKGQMLTEHVSHVWKRYSGGETNSFIRFDETAQKSKGKREKIKLRNANILVAEDNLVNQIFIEEVLKELECRYKLVSNGEEAVRAVQQDRYNLVLMDCLMPEMDGFEAAKAICILKEQGKISFHLPIIALTANAMKGDKEKCISAGMDDYLAKPVRSRELKETLYKWVVGKNYKSSEDGIENNIRDVQSSDVLIDHDAVVSARNILKERFNDVLSVYFSNSKERMLLNLRMKDMLALMLVLRRNLKESA